ncbi:MAG: OmcA/MtrC family decaheme c-type cytochrome [Shewanella sp.]
MTWVLVPLLLCACNSKDGEDGKPGSLVSTQAQILKLEVTSTDWLNDKFIVKFRATNEQQLGVININNLKLSFAQLQPEDKIQGNASQWQTLATELCNQQQRCTGNLVDNQDGSYQFTMTNTLIGPSAISVNTQFSQRLHLSIDATNTLPKTSIAYDFMLNGEAVTSTRNIVDSTQCLACHDDIATIKHGGDSLEHCMSCHTDNNMNNPDHIWPTLVHKAHIGVSPEPVGNCQSCHQMQASSKLMQAMNWQETPTRATCSHCHDMTSNEVYNHKTQLDNSQCLTCHQPQNTQDVHLGKYLTAQADDQRGMVSIDMREAKLVQDNGQQFALISFALLDKQGAEIIIPGNNPANADWIMNLQLYVNWGTSVDFSASRGYTIYVKSNKKDITQDGSQGSTPAGERERTPMFSNQGNVYTYKMGPIVIEDTISGNLLDDAGFISERLIFCFNSQQELVSCKSSNHSKNAAWNNRWFFTESGLTSDPSYQRPQIVSNEKCGSCHGYDEIRDNTQLACRSCHSQPTNINKELADTTCFSGHDHGPNGEHLQPLEQKKLSPTGKPSFISSTADIVDPCLACHNPNTPPTQAIREMHTKASDWDFVEQLTVSHPDHKVWMHSLHTNQRATQANDKGVRSIDYPADKANCYRCHVGDTFGVERLTERGRPLALDLDYNPDSKAHPAIDISVDAYTSPVSATCYACHAKIVNDKGVKIINKSVRAHMEMHGGRFGVPLDKLVTESCSVCHSVKNLKLAHGL